MLPGMLLTSLAFFASVLGTQHIACFPAYDPYSSERVIISYKNARAGGVLPETGTLFITAGLDDDGNHPISTGPLKTKLVSDAQATSGTALYRTEDELAFYTVSIDAKNIGIATSSLSVSVELERKIDGFKASEDYSCYASFFENESVR